MELAVLAQNIMDLYYQQFKTDEDFFELYHFEFMAAVAYGKLLQDEYEKNYRQNLAEEGFGYVSLSQNWLIREEIKIEKDDNGQLFAELKHQPFTFLYDQQNSGVQGIFPLKESDCIDFIRSQAEQRWALRDLPATKNIFYIPEQKKILFFSKIPNPVKQAYVMYVPQIGEDENSQIPQGRAMDVITSTLNIMVVMRNGTVVDMTNDGNPNKTIGSEINNIFSLIKTKNGG